MRAGVAKHTSLYLTVRAAVPMCVLKVALMSAVPCEALEATPVLLTTATRGFDDVHWESNVMSCVVPSLKVPVAVNGSMLPRTIVGADGLTEILEIEHRSRRWGGSTRRARASASGKADDN